MDEAMLYTYDALIPFAVLTGLVAVPLGLMYLVYPKSILQLYLRYVFISTNECSRVFVILKSDNNLTRSYAVIL